MNYRSAEGYLRDVRAAGAHHLRPQLAPTGFMSPDIATRLRESHRDVAERRWQDVGSPLTAMSAAGISPSSIATTPNDAEAQRPGARTFQTAEKPTRVP